jgi:hypothetical protein
MLTVQLPTLLALLGTALMAVVIFAPKAPAVSVAASCAPPGAPPALEHWTPPAQTSEMPAFEPAAPERRFDLRVAAAWPALIDPSAAGCDSDTRLALVDALGALGTPWAAAILERAWLDDPDEAVQRRVAAVLGG